MDVNAFDLAMGAMVLPPVIAVINQRRWPPQLKGVVAFAVCAVYSLLVLVLRGPVNFRDWRGTLLVVAGAAFAAHALFWRPSGIAPTIEAATSSGSPAPVDRGAHPVT